MGYVQPEPYKQEDYKTGEMNLLTLEKELIIKAMSKTGGNVEMAAKELGILPITLERKMPRHHIKREYFLTPKSEENGNTKN